MCVYTKTCVWAGAKNICLCVCVWNDDRICLRPYVNRVTFLRHVFFTFFVGRIPFLCRSVCRSENCVCAECDDASRFLRFWGEFLRNAKFARICANLREIFCCGQRAWTSLAGGTVRGNVAGLWVLRACEFPSFFESFFLFVFFPSFFPLFSLFPSIFLFLVLPR